jgi:hypothetical protein
MTPEVWMSLMGMGSASKSGRPYDLLPDTELIEAICANETALPGRQVKRQEVMQSRVKTRKSCPGM